MRILSEQICSQVVPKTSKVPTQYAYGSFGLSIKANITIAAALTKNATGRVIYGDTLSTKIPIRGLSERATAIEQSIRFA